MRAFAVIAALAVAGTVAAAPRKHHKRGQAHATARLHKRSRVTHAPPPSATPSDPLDPQLQISAPRASVERPREPAEAAPVPPHDAPPAPPEPAQLAPSASASAKVDLSLHENEAPPPAIVGSTPAPRKSASSDTGRQRRWGLFGGGVAMFLIGYGADIGLTYGLHHEPATSSLIPIAGPLVQMRDSWAMVARANTGNPQIDAQANPRIDAVNAQIQTAAYAALAVDCAIQVIGTGLTVAGVVGKARGKFASLEPSPSGVRVRF